MRSRRILLRPASFALALLLPSLSGALHGQLDQERRAPEAFPTALTGVVERSDGEPVRGAIVVTSLGGQAVTGPAGRFELVLDVPAAASALHVTAASSRGGANLVGTVLAGPVTGAALDVGTIVIEASAGCEPSWLPTFGSFPGVSGGDHTYVSSFAVFDDGSGPALYAGGEFTTAGGTSARYVARWDGSTWSPLGSGMSGDGTCVKFCGYGVFALAVFDDGGGPALFAGGHFAFAGGVPAKSIARWDGSTWSPVGSGLDEFAYVLTLAVFDDGGGPALFAGGNFDFAGGSAASNVAKWDGSTWSSPGGGVAPGSVQILEVFDDGGGPALYAGGSFTTAGGVPASKLARWDGSTWSPVGGGMDAAGSVSALAVFDDGTGSALYAGGAFTTAGAVAASNVARWDGTTWSPVGSGVDEPGVYALAVLDDGGGPALYAGGRFDAAGGVAVSHIARWDGSAWSALGSGMSLAPGLPALPTSVYALGVFDDGAGPALFAGGSFTSAGDVPAEYIARWSGSSWSPIGSGLNGSVGALAVFDDGSGPALFAGGSFTAAGGVATAGVARWDGSNWAPLGSGTRMGGSEYVSVLLVFDDGGGPALYAGGRFTIAGGVAVNHVARWDGSTWSSLGTGVSGSTSPAVHALAVFDDGGGPALYAGGRFTTAGGVEANHVAKWDGSTWASLGTGMSGTSSPGVYALEAFDDGGGPALYAGGVFTTAGGVGAIHVAKWDGASWSPLGSGIIDAPLAYVTTLAVFDDGGGPGLYAGGLFTVVGDVASKIARWDGTSWSPLGSGTDHAVVSLSVFDDGGGPALYAGGAFTTAGGIGANKVARWNGASWSPLGSGANSSIAAFAAFDDGGGPALYAGGSFSIAFDSGDSYLAKWGCDSALVPVPGCFDNPVQLSASSDKASVGAPLTVQLEGGTFASGLALLFAGAGGTNTEGCGLPLTGYGEMLLALAPTPLLVAREVSAGGSATLSVAVPPDPTLVGMTIHLQAAHAGAPPEFPVEMSTGLAVTLSG